MKRLFICAAAVIIAAAGFVFFRYNSSGVINTSEREGIAMDTVMKITASAPLSKERLDSALAEAFALIDELDGKLSMHSASSDISAINAAAGSAPVRVPKDTASLISSAVDISKATGGEFDPAIGALTSLWHIGKRSKSGDTPPAHDEISSALKLIGSDKIKLTGPDTVYLTTAGSKIDLGGIAKGYASQRVAELLEAKGITSALIDLGGNIMLLGSTTEGSDWNIGIQHPRKPRGTPACLVQASGTSIITSGVYERFADIEGERRTHIFDPHTGYPISGDLISVTVVCKDPTKGDALSTALIVMGRERALSFLKNEPDTEALFFTELKGGKIDITATKGLANILKPLDSDITISFVSVR